MAAELITALKSQAGNRGHPDRDRRRKAERLRSKEKRANFAIFKDIDIEDQLGKALTTVLGEKAVTKAAGK